MRKQKSADLLADGLSSIGGAGMILHERYGYVCIVM